MRVFGLRAQWRDGGDVSVFQTSCLTGDVDPALTGWAGMYRGVAPRDNEPRVGMRCRVYWWGCWQWVGLVAIGGVGGNWCGCLDCARDGVMRGCVGLADLLFDGGC